MQLFILLLVAATALSQACYHGQVRLVDGPSHREGRVEVCQNGQWGAVCSQAWSQSQADQLCYQLGFPNQGATVSSTASAQGTSYSCTFVSGTSLTCTASSCSNNLVLQITCAGFRTEIVPDIRNELALLYQQIINQLQNQCLDNIAPLQNGCTTTQIGLIEGICNGIQSVFAEENCEVIESEIGIQFERQFEASLEECNNNINELRAQSDDELERCNSTVNMLTESLTNQTNSTQHLCAAQIHALQGLCLEQLNISQSQCNDQLLEAEHVYNSSIMSLKYECEVQLLVAEQHCNNSIDNLVTTINQLRMDYEEQLRSLNQSVENNTRQCEDLLAVVEQRHNASIQNLTGQCVQESQSIRMECGANITEEREQCQAQVLAAQEACQRSMTTSGVIAGTQAPLMSTDNEMVIGTLGALTGILAVLCIALAIGWAITCYTASVMRQNINLPAKIPPDLALTNSIVHEQIDNPTYNDNCCEAQEPPEATYETLDVVGPFIPPQPNKQPSPMGGDDQENIYHTVSGDEELYSMPEPAD